MGEAKRRQLAVQNQALEAMAVDMPGGRIHVEWEDHTARATPNAQLTFFAECLAATGVYTVFRSLKSELGLRPVFHHTQTRTDGHLFITVLAYQCVQVIRTALKVAGIHDSWASLRKTLQVQRRTTTSMRREDGRMVHVRKTSRPEPALLRIYQALGLNPLPDGVKILVV